MMRSFARFLIVLSVFAAMAARAQVSYTGGVYSQNFDTLPGTTNNTLNTAWTDNVTLAGWYANKTTFSVTDGTIGGSAASGAAPNGTLSGSTLPQWVNTKAFANSPNTPLTAALTSPADDSTFDSYSPPTLAASASNPDGSVAKVEFYSGSTKHAGQLHLHSHSQRADRRSYRDLPDHRSAQLPRLV